MNSLRTVVPLLMVLWTASPAWAADDDEVGDEGAATAPSGAAAQKTLAERVPSVTRRVFSKTGRVELVPGVGLSLNDPFYDHVVVSARAAYHVSEWLWVQASGDFMGSIKTAVSVSPLGIGNPPAYNRPKLGGGLELGFAPLYGKFSLLAEQVIHFDTYVAAGGGLVVPTDGPTLLAGSAAVGQHYFVNEWLAVRLELRDQIYRMARAPSVSQDKVLQNMVSFLFGVAFFVPPTFQHEVL